jgi:hypothetical protein
MPMTTQRITSADPETVVLRLARESDTPALRELAELDSALPLGGAILVAVRNGGIPAAISLHSDRVVADPFQPTADLSGLLRARVALLRGERVSTGRNVARRLLRAAA